MKPRMMALLLFLCFSFPLSALGGSDYLMDVESKILSGDLNGAYELFTSGPFIRKNPQLHSKVSNEVETVLRFYSESVKFNKSIASGNENIALAHFRNAKFFHDKLPATLHFSEKLSQTIEASYQRNSEKYKSMVSKIAASEEQEAARMSNEKDARISVIKTELAEEEKKKAAEIASAKKKNEELQKRLEQEQGEAERERAAYIESMQKACGADYGQLRIGMTLDRANKCYGDFFLRGQVQFKQYGTVSRYTRGDTVLYVKDGRIVAWDSF